jgi:nitroreductase
MELTEALRGTAAIRDFTDEPVSDETLYRVLDTARFAPSGGNRQGWRVVVVKDPAVRAGLRDLYLPGWYDYLALRGADLVPWAPISDTAAEEAALAAVRPEGDPARAGFAENLDKVPALLVVLADLRALAAVDRGYERYTFAGGASVYPFVWNVLLAARNEGFGGVLTTMAVAEEPGVRELLGIPDGFAVAAVLPLGKPQRQVTRLTRNPVAEFATRERFDGESL